ncbi:hypothetical protein NF867_05510 [Solitalea sp. MAHUQ-68]|uniref:DUF6923 domain-containing protein n=1 Tax=Solitalea agri TaxID=2953739 RepID=A0A9X2F0E8_9SPHI|nr:hypothetical protein [Solitalea agri]MCO4292317.1 hypothetical protein [Solitalea agri]
MQKSLLIIAFISSSIYANAQSGIKTITGFSHPESVCQHGSTIYVSNVGEKLEPDQKDNDGFISKVNLKTGKIEELKFITGLNAPKGLAIADNVLYVTDIDRVLGFNLKSKEKVFELTISESVFINDIEAAKGILYALATDNGKIFEIDIQNKTYKTIAFATVPGANGLSYSAKANKLYCAGFSSDGQKPNGNVYEINLTNKTMKKLSDYEGFLDGTALKAGKLYISDWKAFEKKGVLTEVDLNSNESHAIKLHDLISGPADFIISNDGNFFIIPEMIAGNILIEEIK